MSKSIETSSSQLTERFIALERAIVQAGERIPTQDSDQLESHLEAVRQRLEAGVDWTVIALVGGTGSGKSSLFNALTGIDFAEVGVKRPTTSQPLACVWGEGADKLLDQLKITPTNRFQRESALDEGTEDELRGLVLVDVPDHDSVAEEHREFVDQIVPLADVLIWVLDPQKYADAAVHGDYLQQLQGHERSLMIALNKTDTVPEHDLPALLEDLGRLLRDDGLDEITICPVSTVTETGISQLRDLLARLTQTRSAAAERAAVDLRAIGELLAPTVAKAEPLKAELPVDTTVDAFSEAGDFLALEARMRDALGGVKTADQLPRIDSHHPIDRELIEGAREKMIAAARDDLPELWAQSVTAAVPPSSEIDEELREKMREAQIPLPLTGIRRARAATNTLLWVLFAITICWAGWLIAQPTSAPKAPEMNLPGISAVLAKLGSGLEVPLLIALFLILALVFAAAVFRSKLRAASQKGAGEYGHALRRCASDLVTERILTPVLAVHNSHREVREVIVRVRSELEGDRPADVVSAGH